MNNEIKKLGLKPLDELKTYLEDMDLDKLKKLKTHLDDLYYNVGDSGFSDFRYDVLKEVLDKRTPNFMGGIGAKVGVNESAKLPFYLGSMAKIKPEDTGKLERWLAKNPTGNYMISGKLDGVSCLAVYKSGKKVKLYTRGNGKIGKDISWLAQYNPSIPRSLDMDINVRGELILPDEVFTKKYTKNYSNARAMVTGLLGAKTVRRGTSDMHFVTYEVLLKGSAPSPEKQFEQMDEAGFEVVQHELVTEIDMDTLTEYLLQYKKKSPYYLDGLIVHSNISVKRKAIKYPEYAFAFKIDGEQADVKVEDVVWSVSQWGAFKPVVHINPTFLGGVTINKATAHNAKYIWENNIGPGAVITVIRSGDVIPKIINVVTPADEPQMPKEDYKWNDTHVNIYATGKKHMKKMCIKRIYRFFQKLEVKEIGPSRVATMYNNGLVSVIRILSASKKEIIKAVASDAVGQKIYANIRTALHNPSIQMFVGASGVFGEGIGRERISVLVDAIPDVLTRGPTISKKALKKEVLQVEGFSNITANLIVNNIYWGGAFATVIEKLSTKSVLPIIEPVIKGDSLKGMTFVVTGFTSKKLEAQIASLGGTYTTKWTVKAAGVIASEKSLEKRTGKIKKADAKGISVYSLEEFTEKFLS